MPMTHAADTDFSPSADWLRAAFDAALEAGQPLRITQSACMGITPPTAVIALGKAAGAMADPPLTPHQRQRVTNRQTAKNQYRQRASSALDNRINQIITGKEGPRILDHFHPHCVSGLNCCRAKMRQ